MGAVHPRTCGEHQHRISPLYLETGSSPHMRGTSQPRVHALATVRFIPAHAGNISSGRCMVNILSVHPRTCGEHYHPHLPLPRLTGSSPHMRGTLRHRNVNAPRDRFIPAHAGNIYSRTLRLIGPAVHPRTCGEHEPSRIIIAYSGGSSPHMRGTSPAIDDHAAFDRFIPAHAGNIPAAKAEDSHRPVHPRTCGEHAPAPQICLHPCGSSPHMRGTSQNTVEAARGGRFIPAHAGNMV